MNYIPKSLSYEIRKKIKKIREQEKKERKHLPKDNRLRGIIRRNSQIDSYKIENLEEFNGYGFPKKRRKKITKEGINDLENAFQWGKKNFDKYKIDENYLKTLNYLIVPKIYQDEKPHFRDSSARIKWSHIIPPSPDKIITKEIPNFLKALRRHLNSEDVIQQMESGIYAHFHIARIHPFDDGNGRTARTLQNIILNHFNIPLPIITQFERGYYNSILEKAFKDWRENNNWEPNSKITKGEREFYYFITEKINQSLDYFLSK